MSDGVRRRLCGIRAAIGIGVLTVLTMGTGMVCFSFYSMWSAQKAELAQADQNRQVAVTQARTKAESTRFEADAEITRAEGVRTPAEHDIPFAG